jgi:polar amino acid transport system permease protein
MNFSDISEFAPALAQGTELTVLLTILSMALALVLGLLVGGGGGEEPSPAQRCSLGAYVDLLRGTPLLLQLFYIYFVLPYVGIRLPAIPAGIAGLSLNYAAYLSEVYRAAIGAIDPGQTEASRALGMSSRLAFRRIIAPQALRIALPPIGNYFIAMFKDTALVAIISVEELMFTAEQLGATTYKYLEIFTATFLIYLLISYPASLAVQAMERRMRRRIRRRPQMATMSPLASHT